MGLAPAVGPIETIQNLLKGQNTYPNDQCTWQAKQDASWLPNYLGDARDWFAKLHMQGYPTSSVPVPGSIMIYQAGEGGARGAGHVAYVTSVNPDWTVNLDERNWTNPGQSDQRQNVKWQGVVQGFALDKTSGDTATQYELSYAKGEKAPAGGPNFSATGAVGAVGGWASGLVSKPFLGVVQIAVGTLLVLAAILIFGLVALRGVAAAKAGVTGTVRRVTPGGRRPTTRSVTAPSAPAAVTPHRAAMQRAQLRTARARARGAEAKARPARRAPDIETSYETTGELP